MHQLANISQFEQLQATANATMGMSQMSVFNVSDEDYAKAQQGLQGILNVLKQPEWRADLSVEQRASLQNIVGRQKS